MRIKKMKPSSSRHSIPTLPPVREEKKLPAGAKGLFPAGFNPMASLGNLRKTSDSSVSTSQPSLRPPAGIPVGFNPADALKGLRSSKTQTNKSEDATESEKPKAMGIGGMGGFNPADALKGLRSTKAPASEPRSTQAPMGGFDPAAALKGLRSTKKPDN